jgi:hypothetical protein
LRAQSPEIVEALKYVAEVTIRKTLDEEGLPLRIVSETHGIDVSLTLAEYIEIRITVVEVVKRP